MITDRLGQVKMPEVHSDPAYEAAKKNANMVGDEKDFQSMLSESNTQRQKEIEQEKAANGGQLNFGDTKSDKEFKEMLEKITGKRQDKLKNKLEKDDYLNLMVTQLKYQDPTKPMDNQEMATQMAQFNTVEQLISINKALVDLKSQQSETKVDKLAQYLGTTVQVSGNTIKVGNNKSVTQGAFNLPDPASTVSVSIKDDAGNVVKTLSLGAMETGNHKVEWNGQDESGKTVQPGKYTFEINASTDDGKAISATTSFMTKVEGITDIATGGKLETLIGPIEVKDIQAIRSSDKESSRPAKPTPAATAKVGADTQPAADTQSLNPKSAEGNSEATKPADKTVGNALNAAAASALQQLQPNAAKNARQPAPAKQVERPAEKSADKVTEKVTEKVGEKMTEKSEKKSKAA